MKKYAAYYRVSTAKQGESGLGLAAQREAVRAYVTSQDGTMIEEITEVASGGKTDRQGLARAMKVCRDHGATLVVYKLDRLTRTVTDILNQGIDIAMLDISVDTSTPAGKLMTNIMMAVAQFEREIISQRIRDGNAQALKDPKRAKRMPKAVCKAKRDAYLSEYQEAIEDVLAGLGEYTTRTAGRALTKAGVPTPSGNTYWHPMTVARTLKHIGDARPPYAEEWGPRIKDEVIMAYSSMEHAGLRQIAQVLEDANIPTPRGGSTWQAVQVSRMLNRLGIERR
jgi:DNA invertase Pin-like site-specific DNA recombinase